MVSSPVVYDDSGSGSWNISLGGGCTLVTIIWYGFKWFKGEEIDNEPIMTQKTKHN